MAEGKMTADYLFLDNIPRQQSFACLSLKFGCIISGITIILFSIFALAQCVLTLETLPSQLKASDVSSMVMYGLVIGVTITHAVTLFLSSLMLTGAVMERAYLIRPWVIWLSIQVTVSILVFVFYSTMSMINHFGDGSLVIYAIEFLIILVRFYMLMTVCNYYRHLVLEKGENERLVKLINHDSWYSA